MNYQADKKSDLLKQLDLLSEEYRKVIAETSIDHMNLQVDGKWSIYQNIDHINKSNKLTAVGYMTPKFMLQTLFGKSKNGSRTTEEIIHLYQAELQNGAKSPKLFEAGASKIKESSSLLQKYNDQISSLKSQVESWSDEELNIYRMKHPILGNLTGKEMLSFTVYHQFHHLNTIQRILDRV